MTTTSKLSVLVPVYNEAATVATVVERLRAIALPVEIVAIDDGSSDGTAEVLAALRADNRIDSLITQTVNRGKGAAIRAGIIAATGDIIVVQDADLEYDPAELPRLIQPILDGKADAVFGSRFLGGDHRVLYFWHSVGNALLTLLSNMLTDLNLTDMETCYKAVRAPVMKGLVLTSDRFGFEPEITARLAQARARIWEISISYSGRTYAEGKKIGWRDGVAALWHILRFNLLPPRGAVAPPSTPNPPPTSRSRIDWAAEERARSPAGTPEPASPTTGIRLPPARGLEDRAGRAGGPAS
jgi:glycosyltransferase involved in cell wall biosynthesis